MPSKNEQNTVSHMAIFNATWDPLFQIVTRNCKWQLVSLIIINLISYPIIFALENEGQNANRVARHQEGGIL